MSKQTNQTFPTTNTYYPRYIIIPAFLLDEFEDTKGVIRIHISKKNRQHNAQKKKVQKDKQQSTKHTYIKDKQRSIKPIDRVT
jgi:hypothetical protein